MPSSMVLDLDGTFEDLLLLLHLLEQLVGQVPVGMDIRHQTPNITVNILHKFIVMDLLLEDLFM